MAILFGITWALARLTPHVFTSIPDQFEALPNTLQSEILRYLPAPFKLHELQNYPQNRQVQNATNHLVVAMRAERIQKWAQKLKDLLNHSTVVLSSALDVVGAAVAATMILDCIDKS
jgi:predicted PurR-regulated permease PerM